MGNGRWVLFNYYCDIHPNIRTKAQYRDIHCWPSNYWYRPGYCIKYAVITRVPWTYLTAMQLPARFTSVN